MTDETAWLVERQDPRNPGSVTGNFLGFVGLFSGASAKGGFAWMTHANNALRFSRREDAEMFIGALMHLHDRIPHGETMHGFRSGDARPISVEHSWSDAGSSAT